MLIQINKEINDEFDKIIKAIAKINSIRDRKYKTNEENIVISKISYAKALQSFKKTQFFQN